MSISITLLIYYVFKSLQRRGKWIMGQIYCWSGLRHDYQMWAHTDTQKKRKRITPAYTSWKMCGRVEPMCHVGTKEMYGQAGRQTEAVHYLLTESCCNGPDANCALRKVSELKGSLRVDAVKINCTLRLQAKTKTLSSFSKFSLSLQI